MEQGFGDMVSPHSERNVLTAVQELMRSEGAAVTLSAIARRSGTSRNFLYSAWKSLGALQERAVTAEVMNLFNAAEDACPVDGTVSGTVAHLVYVARSIRHHPTTAAIARTAPAAMAHALTAMDGLLSDAARHRVKQLLYPLRLTDTEHELAAVGALAWKILWIARPAALCPQAVGDPDRERTLDLGLSLLLTDLLAAPSRTVPDSPETLER